MNAPQAFPATPLIRSRAVLAQPVDVFAMAKAIPERSYAEWMEEGREWALKTYHARSSYCCNDYALNQSAAAYVDANAPKVAAAHRAKQRKAREAEFGIPPVTAKVSRGNPALVSILLRDGPRFVDACEREGFQ